MLKITYLSGAADFPATYAHVKENAASRFFGTNYMGLFIKLVEAVGASAQVFTWREGAKVQRRFGSRFEELNWPLPVASGLAYHVKMVAWNFRALLRIWKYKPDILLLTGNQDYWWVYWPIALRRTKIIASFHCVQWPVAIPPRPHKRVFAWLNARLTLSRASAIVVTSKAILRQVQAMLGPAPAPIIEHLPTYDPNQFAGLRPPLRQSGEPFTVLFVGRLEANKGIFDVLQIAEELQAERRGEFRFDICGDGSARDRFLSLVDEKGLGDSIVYHGYCDAAKLREIIETAHVFIVPTRSEFEAGFEMTCAESILSGRPLVTSKVAPAIEYLGQAAIEVPPDDVPAYKAAITSLADDAQLYDQKARGCALAAGMFLDESNSWSRAMIEALGKAGVHADGQVNRPLA